MRWLLSPLGLTDATPAERRATFWTAAMSAFALASTFVLRPLRDQFGVDQGAANTPYLFALTLLVTAMFMPPFWWLANRMPSRRFVPVALHSLAVGLLALFLALRAVGDYDWRAPQARWIGEAFWGFYNALNVAVPTLVWIHAVEHFRRDQGLRLFGLIGVGGTAGAVFGTRAAKWLVGWGLPPSSAALAALLLLELAFACYLLSRRACAVLVRESADAHCAVPSSPIAGGGLFAGLRLLARERYLLAIAAYMLLLGMVATAFYVAQTEIVGRQVAGARVQHGLLADVESLSQSLVLVLQLFCTGRLLRRLPTAVFLCLLPLLATVGLGVLCLWQWVTAIAVVQVVRRGAQFALEKPAREVLYTPLDLETKHKVKFLLDTFAFRFGDLLGAWFQVLVLPSGQGVGSAALATMGLCALWAMLGLWLGRRPQSLAGRSLDPAG